MNSLKQLALRYGILTEYTSYLVQEPTVAARAEAEHRVMQAPAPAPVDQAGAGSVGRAGTEQSIAGAMRLGAGAGRGPADAPERAGMRSGRAGISGYTGP